jgi:hypothetical protein
VERSPEKKTAGLMLRPDIFYLRLRFLTASDFFLRFTLGFS